MALEEETRMKHYRTGAMICLLLCISVSIMGAAPVAEDAYRNLQSLDLNELSADQIISEYEDFYERIYTMAENARDDMLKARSSGDRERIRLSRCFTTLRCIARYTSTPKATVLPVFIIISAEKP